MPSATTVFRYGEAGRHDLRDRNTMKDWLSIFAESIKECGSLFKIASIAVAANILLAAVSWWVHEGNTPMPDYLLRQFWAGAVLAAIIVGIVFLCELDSVRDKRERLRRLRKKIEDAHKTDIG
jgi:hypothetical protein